VFVGDDEREAGFVEVGRTIATDVHHVDSPLFDRAGRLYLTHSGSRDTRAAEPLFRLGLDGVRVSLAVEIANPTSLALGPDDAVYISSRFDGHVYRLNAEDHAEIYATELGVATGLAFAPDGTLFVGDRSGQILRVSPEKRVDNFATLPSSVAAFHLSYGPDACLYVTAPTLATRDAVYRITPDRLVDVVNDQFGRPQGLAFDARGRLYVVEALAGAAGLFRLDATTPSLPPTLLVSAPALVGVAFGPAGQLILASNDTVWQFDVAPDDAESETNTPAGL
jgi:sugar lactone lactonase YvrE